GMWLGFLGVVIFAATLPATRLAVVGLDPFFTSMGRAAVAGILSAAILLVMRRKWPTLPQLRLMVVIVISMVIGFASLMALSLQTVPAAHGGVVLGILPLSTVAAASILLGERPSLRFWFLALLGTVVVVAFALRGGGGTVAIGDVYMFASAILSSIGY